MAAQLITLPFRPVINLQGGIEPGALLDVFLSGTTTRISVYSDTALTVPLTNPVVAASNGAFPAVYFDDAVPVRVRVRPADGGAALSDTDPYITDYADVEASLDAADAAAAAALVSQNAASASAIAAAASAVTSGNSASAAATSAASAANAPGTSATSTTSNTIGTGSKSFTIQTGKAYVIGQFVLAARTAAPTNWMFGQITAYDTGTGALTINVTKTGGSGTFTDWTISLSGVAGADGAGSGTVTSVGGTGTVNGITLTGTVTASGNLTLGGTLANVGLTTQVTGVLPVANGGTNATTAADARTSLGAAASGANTDITALDQDVTVTATGTIAADSIGYRGLPQNAQGGAYALVLADAGKHISISTGGITIPANASVAFPIGTVIAVYNNSASSQNIAITTDTLRLAGTATTGTRVLLQRGFCTLTKVAATEWVAGGNIT